MKKRTLQSLILGIAIGAAVGLGVYTFVYAKGASYLMNDPASCANCHVMNEQYDGWLKSSHHAVATCNDCHTPANFLGKYATKASNGFWHSFYFTTGGFHEPIQIKKRNLEITDTERQLAANQPGACMHCHASVYVSYKKLGGGDLIKGFEAMNQMPYAEARKLVTRPVACIDCHDPKNMQLRLTRPGFIEGIRAFKASQGIQNYDVNAMATRQEMRSFVCGQCHVEYYFKGSEKRLVYPWSKGLKVDQIMAYYEETGHKDWTHADTGAPTLKAQHPEFEMWNQGIHARSGVACADCHMPYKREGALKISDHHVNSPLLKINRSCQTCHKWPEDELKARVETIQERHFALRNIAMDALMDLINDLKSGKAAGRSDAELSAARNFQRKAQFYLDFVEAENSTGFHAPQEAARILGESINFSRQGQNALRSKGRPAP